MDAARDQEKLSGSYYYSTIGIPISIEGNINDDGSFNLKEYGNGSVTGIFEGLMPAKGDISGSWYNAKKSKSLPMTLTQVTEGFALVTIDDRSSKNCKFAKEMEAEGIANGCTTLNVQYLTVNCGSPEISTKINSTLISNITDVGGSGQKINTIDQLMKTVNIESAEEGFNGDINFNVVTNGNKTLSISIYNNWYSFGAAHPIYNTVYNNFDLRTGNIIQLEELLKPGFEEPIS